MNNLINKSMLNVEQWTSQIYASKIKHASIASYVGLSW